MINPLKLNLMCGDLPIEGNYWINCDISKSPHIKSDLVIDCTKLANHFEACSVDEIYCGHGLEHVMPQDIDRTIEDWKYVLKENGVLTIVTPDIKVIADMYLSGGIDVEEFQDKYVFSYVQESIHRTMWDVTRLIKLFIKYDFRDIKQIDRLNDSRVAFGVPWQCGVTGVKQEGSTL